MEAAKELQAAVKEGLRPKPSPGAGGQGLFCFPLLVLKGIYHY